jgi:hypothetical protein
MGCHYNLHRALKTGPSSIWGSAKAWSDRGGPHERGSSCRLQNRDETTWGLTRYGFPNRCDVVQILYLLLINTIATVLGSGGAGWIDRCAAPNQHRPQPWYLLGEWAMQRDVHFRNVAPTRLYPIHYLLAQP